MKTHTQDYKNEIKILGRELDNIISYPEGMFTIELGNRDLNSISLHYEGDILKSVMKELDIDSNIDIPLNKVLNYRFGIKIDDDYEYLDMGNFVVFSSEKQEDTNSYKIKCYDKMIYSMKDFEDLNITYPITIRNYLIALCNHLGLTFKNANTTFTNYNKIIKNELYLDTEGKSLGYTFRDVFDELAQATASTICLDENDNVEIRYINNTNDTIGKEHLKDINVNFGEKYGPINSIVLSRAGGSDNVYLQDEQSVQRNGLCEIKISDNQIMSDNDRGDFLQGILDRLDGLEYYINDFSSTGITYYDLCDRYNILINNKTYSCIMFNDEINITQGLEELINTEMPEQSETDYKKADKTDRRINQTIIEVDKQAGEIRELASKIVDVSKTIMGINQITLENAFKGGIHQLKITGDMSLVFPNDSEKYGFSQMISEDLIVNQDRLISSGVPYGNDTLYPSSTLYPKKIKIQVDDTLYDTNIDYLNYIDADTHDDWIYLEGKQYIIRRVGIDQQGEKYELYNEVIEELPDIGPILIESNSTISIIGENGIIEALYLLENDYTEVFATKYEVTSEINIKAGEIEEKVSGVADEDGNVTAASIILSINRDESSASIEADKISLKGKSINLTSDNIVINSDNFSVDEEGHIEATSGVIGGFGLLTNKFEAISSITRNYTEDDATRISQIILGTVTPTDEDYEKYDLNGDKIIDSRDYVRVRSIINGLIPATQTCDFSINSDDPVHCFKIINEFDNAENVMFGMYGGYVKELSAQTLNVSSQVRFISGTGQTSLINMYASSGLIECVSLVQTSKKEFKKNFEKLENALDIIKNIDIYKYNMKNEEDTDKQHIGFVIGDEFNYSEDITSKDNNGVDLYSFVSLCCKAIQEQQEQINELKERLNKLEGNDK